ncbi:RNA polymerase factor sigma-54 [Sphingomonas sp.]|jgi:RNA polymerase sigma-54 factor|uniref:RNA polymerase factor sigma-54 n=1 Tax=Sphingomonas sp. TaxID=28214 RepID=UPI002DE6B30C|nr:RNA polymerase factor sigma-54 [Sphingomonas sp.]HEV2569687.1 RNA polymerase factor sigma-54 [Sphingomonas sp.]
MASLAPRLDLRQSQLLVMTPQLQQAIKLLALSNLEIESFIAEELEKNPLLETGGDERPATEPVESDGGEDWDGESAPEPVTADRLVEHGDGVADSPLDVDLVAETFHHDGPSDSYLDGSMGAGGASGGVGEEGIDFDSFSAEVETLQEHLLAQAGERLSGTDHAIAVWLIGQIDEAGYLTGELAEVAQQAGVPLDQVERVLGVVQSFDPTGVGARSLAECLALQAKEADRYDPCMARLIANLDLVAAGKLQQLKRICQVDDEDLADMVRELRSYDPKPGLKFGASRTETVVPDIFVAKRPIGWAIELNSATLPRLLVNRRYYAELASGPQDKSSKAWLADCLHSANWLIKALDQRQRTIIKVASEIVKQQEAFFLKGVEHLKPLTLRQVAEVIGMHESTVSRVTSNKYLSCARGVFELKYFFTSGIQSADGGDAVSAEAVKSAIKGLIGAEAPDAILSDDTLVDLLKGKGFDIARRTVAKYREAMGIGSSVQRRRQKALRAA